MSGLDRSSGERPAPVFGHVGDFVESWLAPTLAGKFTGSGGSGGRVWCPQWWRHPEVAVRLTALWQAWEAARATGSADAMSAWWVHHADPHLRALCDGDTGPMYRCGGARHHDLPPFPTVSVPPDWFDDLAT